MDRSLDEIVAESQVWMELMLFFNNIIIKNCRDHNLLTSKRSKENEAPDLVEVVVAGLESATLIPAMA